MDGYTTTNVWFNQTILHPLGLAMLLLLGLATLLVPRRYALVPALILACFVSPAQRVVVLSLDFHFIRAMTAFGLVRILLRGELKGFRWKPLDTAVVAWGVCATVAGSMLYGTSAGLVYHLGLLYDALGLYFLGRVIVRDWDDVIAFARCAAVISVPMATAFLVEKATGRNMFAFFGGVPEITVVRDGKLRCQGPFDHSIFAGTFWAVLMPLVGALWWDRGWSRGLAAVGVTCSAMIVVACASATPLGGMLVGLGAAARYPFRRHMSLVRWSAVAVIILLQIVMINPIWHLLARVPLVSGSTGWYRYKLIDEFVRHFAEWCVIGTRGYESWPGPGFTAITNEYVRQGVNGGLMTLSLFIAIIVAAFVTIGRIGRSSAAPRRIVVSAADGTPRVAEPGPKAVARARVHTAMAWGLGVSLFIHCVVFVGVSYFGQVLLIWYLGLAFVGSLAPARRRHRIVAVRRPQPTPALVPVGA